jgi:soluble P-type ATPase
MGTQHSVPHMVKRGIQIDIPGFRNLDIRAVCSDYTGTLSLEGELIHGVKKRLRKLASLVDIYVLTSDTRGTAKIELQRIPLNPIIVEARKHDVEKRNYLRKNLEPKHVAVFGNGRNDKLWLREVSKAGGLAIAVDVGEGCAIEALQSADIFVSGITNALDLLLDSDRAKATLRS